MTNKQYPEGSQTDIKLHILSVRISKRKGEALQNDFCCFHFECDATVKQADLERIEEIMIVNNEDCDTKIHLIPVNIANDETTIEALTKSKKSKLEFYCNIKDDFITDVNSFLKQIGNNQVEVDIFYDAGEPYTFPNIQITQSE